MKNQIGKEARAHGTITADELPPELKGRVKALIYDLSNDDLPMALLDLAHLYGALRVGPPRLNKFDEPVELTEDLVRSSSPRTAPRSKKFAWARLSTASARSRMEDTRSAV